MGRIADNGEFRVSGESNIHSSQHRNKFLKLHPGRRSTIMNVVLGDVLSDYLDKGNAFEFMNMSALDFGNANKAADTRQQQWQPDPTCEVVKRPVID